MAHRGERERERERERSAMVPLLMMRGREYSLDRRVGGVRHDASRCACSHGHRLHAGEERQAAFGGGRRRRRQQQYQQQQRCLRVAAASSDQASGGDSVSSVPTALEADLVLSSGFLAFGNHSGFLSAVEEQQVLVKGVMGTSAGALTGSMYCAGYSPR